MDNNTNDKIDVYDYLNNKGKLKKKSEFKNNKQKKIKFDKLKKKNKQYHITYKNDSDNEPVDTEFDKSNQKKIWK